MNMSCTICERTFHKDIDLWSHKRDTNHWEPNERKNMKDRLGIYPCDDRCGKFFKSQKKLNRHIRQNAGRFADKGRTCITCTEKFDNPDQLAQHITDTGHSENATRNDHIDYFYKHGVAVSKEDKKASVKIVDDVLDKIMEAVGQAEGGHIYDRNVRKAGSYPIKMKIGKADEFDTQVHLNITPTMTRKRGKIWYRYNALQDDSLNSNMTIERKIQRKPNGMAIPKGYAVLKCDDESIPEHLLHNRDLVPRVVKQDFYDKIKGVVGELNGVTLNKCFHGPALTLTIKPEEGGHHISVDITLTVDWAQPVQPTSFRRGFIRAYDEDTRKRVAEKGYCFVPKKNEFWLISNNSMCQELLRTIDADNGCRRHVNKILKKEIMTCTSRSDDGLPGVSSHILKHHLLWRCEQTKDKDADYWSMDNVDNCLIDAMKHLESCLHNARVIDYFSGSNILNGKDVTVLKTLAGYLKSRRMELLHM